MDAEPFFQLQFPNSWHFSSEILHSNSGVDHRFVGKVDHDAGDIPQLHVAAARFSALERSPCSFFH